MRRFRDGIKSDLPAGSRANRLRECPRTRSSCTASNPKTLGPHERLFCLGARPFRCRSAGTLAGPESGLPLSVLARDRQWPLTALVSALVLAGTGAASPPVVRVHKLDGLSHGKTQCLVRVYATGDEDGPVCLLRCHHAEKLPDRLDADLVGLPPFAVDDGGRAVAMEREVNAAVRTAAADFLDRR